MGSIDPKEGVASIIGSSGVFLDNTGGPLEADQEGSPAGKAKRRFAAKLRSRRKIEGKPLWRLLEKHLLALQQLGRGHMIPRQVCKDAMRAQLVTKMLLFNGLCK
jgi:hypothetical protein